ncbi:MAG: glycosyltransferase family 2 protein, partial [Desulfovibrio sp.]|nr:glycosyltransferase family 2 protein [Desulfovibrio sp.]
MNAVRVGVVIPLFNHGASVADVVKRALAYCPHVLVVDDGSTDTGADKLTGLPIELLRLPTNKGKGAALLAGATALGIKGMTHMVTLDADGQHYPEDLPQMLAAISHTPHAFIVGARDFSTPNVPKSSRFGRRFDAFWMVFQTGQKISDMQSGFRANPLEALRCLRLHERRYAFEIEVLVRAAWAGFAIREIPIHVHYPPREERISHFHPWSDNVSISLLNTRL